MKELPSLAIALIASACFGLSYGINYGTSNQTAYMLGALRLLDRSVLNKDWYAAGTANYHPVFSGVGWFLLLFSRRGLAVGIGLVVAVTLGALSVYWLARQLLADRRLSLSAFLLLLSFTFITRTSGVAGSYIFDFNLQPSTLGSLFLLFALAPFVAGRYWVSGIFLGVSGLFHANYLMLGLATFGLAHLVLGKKDLARRLLHQLGPSVLALLILSPLILRSIASPNAAEAQNILFNIRSPYHYAPKTFEKDFVPFATWQMIGLGAGAWLLRGLAGRGARLGALIASMAALVWTGTLLTTVVTIRQVTQLFVWRYAPFLDMLMQLLLCMATVRIAVEPGLLRRIPPAGLALFWAGAVLLAMLNGRNQETLSLILLLLIAPVLLALAIAAVGRLLARFSWAARARAGVHRVGAWAVLLGSAAMCIGFARPSVKDYARRSNLLVEAHNPELDMYAWIREHTPKDAIFLTPPQLERFRLTAERAIVVDWKGSTYVPSELVDWYHRLEDISGRPGFRGNGDVTAGYNTLDQTRLEALRAKYDLDYAVVYRGHEEALRSYKTAYANGQFMVFSLK